MLGILPKNGELCCFRVDQLMLVLELGTRFADASEQ